MANLHPGQRLASALCVIAGLAIWGAGLVSTRATYAATALFAVAAISCLLASIRSVTRWPWVMLGTGAAILALTDLRRVGDAAAVVQSNSILNLTATVALAAGTIAFGLGKRDMWVSTLLNAAMLTDVLWLFIWYFRVRERFTGIEQLLDFAQINDLATLATGLVTALIGWVLLVPAHTGIRRWLLVTVTLATTCLFAANVHLWLVPGSDEGLPVRALRLSGAGVLALTGAYVALRGAQIPLINVYHRHRDLVAVSVAALVLVTAMATTIRSGLDKNAGITLCSMLIVLLCMHLWEAHHTRQLARKTADQERHLRLLVTETRDIIMELDSKGTIVFASEALRNLLGLQIEALQGSHVSSVLSELTASQLQTLTHVPNARLQPTLRLESVLAAQDGSTVHSESVVTPLPQGYLVAVRDVSERVGLQDRLALVTYRDIVTGLPNRASLDREIRSRLYESAAGEIGLILIELGRSGLSESQVGDDAREELLRAVGRNLRAEVSTGDLVARFSDTRFAVLLRQGTTATAALEEARRLVDSTNAPDLLPDTTLGICAGVCIGGRTALELVRNTELALRHATRHGPGSVSEFEIGLLQQHARNRDLRRRLARTPDQEHWTLLYQPVVDLRTGHIVGVEALLRWIDPEGDLIGIEEVIALAEEFGSIIQIGTWVLETAVEQAVAWDNAGRSIYVAVNISVHQLVAPGFAGLVQRVLTDYGLPPELLVLEITETVVLEQTDETIATLRELRKLGIRIAIDDFGTGYSGLANLRSLPLDILKIDRSFINGIGDGQGDDAVVAAVARLGRELGLQITGEGIETRTQEHRARTLGITAGQGYLFSRPVPAPDLVPIIDRFNTHTAALDL